MREFSIVQSGPHHPKHTAPGATAWIPVALILAITGALWVARIESVYDPPYLMVSIWFLASTLVSVLVVFVLGQSFVFGGSRSSLVLGCAVIAWGSSGLIAGVTRSPDPNLPVTIHNTIAWFSGALNLAGAALLIRPRPLERQRPVWLMMAFGGTLAVVALLSILAFERRLPLFFVQGAGGTPVRQIVLGTAIAAYLLSAAIIISRGRNAGSIFLYWYGLSLVLTATGLFAVMVQPSFGVPLGWAGRSAQYLCGIYMLIGAVRAVQETRHWYIPIETELSQVKQRLRDLFELAADGIIVQDAPAAGWGRLLDANPAACELFGRSVEELRRLSLADLMAPGQQAAASPWSEIAGSENETRHEIVLLRKDGRQIWTEISTRVFHEGETRRAMSVLHDVTRRKKNEQALRESEDRFRTLTEASFEAVAIVEDGRFADGNSRMAEILGYPIDELIGMEVSKLIAPEDVDRVMENVRLGRTSAIEHDIILKDGTRRTVEAHGRTLMYRGRMVRITAIRDITERLRTEANVREAQKLESLGLMAGGLAHDFNNLLVGVIGNASLAQEELPPDSPSIATLDRVIEAAEQLTHLTRQMLAYAGKSSFSVQLLDFSRLIPELTRIVRPSVGADIRVDFHLAPDLPPVEADRSQIQQILANLVLNASEAINDAPGLISLRTSKHFVDAEFRQRFPAAESLETGEYVGLEVADDGPGMDKHVVARAFDPFFSTKFIGRGLGLAAVSGIVRRLKGAILLETAPGRGSRFTVLLPAARGTAECATASLHGSIARGSGLVLVVDDEPVVRQVTDAGLSRAGFEVLVASSGPEAIELLKEKGAAVRVVVLDLSMPGMSGEATLLEMRQLLPELKVIVSSGYTEAEMKQRFQNSAVQGFLPKPYTASSLTEAVSAVAQADLSVPGAAGA